MYVSLSAQLSPSLGIKNNTDETKLTKVKKVRHSVLCRRVGMGSGSREVVVALSTVRIRIVTG